MSLKFETGSFTPTGQLVTVVLDDGTLSIKGISFRISKDGDNINFGAGSSDSIKNKGEVIFYDGAIKRTAISSTYSILSFTNVNGATNRTIAGYVDDDGFDTPGQFTVNFDNFNTGYTVHFDVIGE